MQATNHTSLSAVTQQPTFTANVASTSGRVPGEIELSSLSSAIAEHCVSQPISALGTMPGMNTVVTTNHASHLASMPEEICQTIFAFLNVKDLLNVSGASKKMHQEAIRALNALSEEVTGFTYSRLIHANQEISVHLNQIRGVLQNLPENETILDNMANNTVSCLSCVGKIIKLALIAPLCCLCPCLACCFACYACGVVAEPEMELNAAHATVTAQFLTGSSRVEGQAEALNQLQVNIQKWNRNHTNNPIDLDATKQYAAVIREGHERMFLGYDLSALQRAVKPKIRVADYRNSFGYLLHRLTQEAAVIPRLLDRLLPPLEKPAVVVADAV